MQEIVLFGDVVIRTVQVGTEQWILFPPTPLGECLARLLGGGAEPVPREGYLGVRHDREVDGRLVQLIDGLIGLRWAHPTFTQLELWEG